eukprot:CAMPEP_0113467460 /NCGR_PEP_ID=MMETSP0014_2-20120614/14825_1 /TAXON_ID=2857 /ORGANISM="Nitzschia sp." /LENGTH=693 /DNA_ID=CAMNT_0000359767 /DNA_START=1563 /DNA_END=3644 /DNA_ORIENTATION=- /assembly_acc=CAM_ASM_000159
MQQDNNKMDGLSSDFGDLGLSSGAREWKPPSTTASPGAGGSGGGPQQHPPNLPHSQVPAHFQRQPRPPPPPGRNQQPVHLTSNLTPLGNASPARSVSSRSSGNGGAGGSTPSSNNGTPTIRGPSASSSPSATGSGTGTSRPTADAAAAAKSGGKDTAASVVSQGSVPGKTESISDNSSGKTPPGNVPTGERNDWEELESELNAATVKEYVPGRAWGDDKSKAGSVGSQGSKPYEEIFSKQGQQGQQQAQGGGQDDAQQEPVGPGETTGAAGPGGPPFRSLQSLGLSDDQWRYFRELAHEQTRQLDPSDPRHKAIPVPYSNAWCLDGPNPTNQRSSFGYHCSTFQVVNRDDGFLYCLRRFDNVRSVSPKIASTVLERWASLEHPGIATLHSLFVAQRAVFFVHQYIPGTQNMLQICNPPTLSEAVIWSAVCQMVTIIRRVHGARLALRTMDLRHTMVQMDSMRLRVYLNAVGIVDALEFETRRTIQELQAEDMRCLGRWVLGIAAGADITASTDSQVLANCERYCMQNYSRELRHFIMTLIRSQNPPSIIDVSRVLSGRLMDELDTTQLSLLRTEKSLAGEYESGRALRLLLKLGFVNERPENGANGRWSESGDFYVLKLFRDYVFHQTDGAGNPVMDLGHVVSALNKLDAADEEKIVLSSRDGKSLMVVSYADIARSLNTAFHELVNASSAAQ